MAFDADVPAWGQLQTTTLHLPPQIYYMLWLTNTLVKIQDRSDSHVEILCPPESHAERIYSTVPFFRTTYTAA